MALEILKIQNDGKKLTDLFGDIAAFFEPSIKLALESVSTAFEIIYNPVTKQITDIRADINAVVTSTSGKLTDLANNLTEKLTELAFGLLVELSESTAVRRAECEIYFFETLLPVFADATLPAIAGCVENSTINNFNATDYAVNAFNLLQIELVAVETIASSIGGEVFTCIEPLLNSSLDDSDSMLCLEDVSFLDTIVFGICINFLLFF